MLGYGSIGCALFFIVLGNYALDLELSGAYPVAEQVLGESPSTAIAAIIDLLPFGKFWLVFIAVVGIIFTATTYDSASYTLAAGATRYLKADEHPRRYHRVYWAFALGTLPAVLLFLGGLTALQTASVVASVPLLLIYILLAWSIVKTLRAQSQ
jgi:BCCT family betaine/carnitine transporter